MEEILDNFHDCVFLLDRGGRVVYANRAASDKFGLSPSELIGREISDVLSSSTGVSGELPVGEVFENASPAASNVEYVAEDGLKKILSIKCSPVRDGAGMVSQAAMVLEDVTENIKAAQLLERYAEGLTVLHELSGIFFAGRGLKQTMDEALALISEYYGADAAVLSVPTGEVGVELECLAAAGLGPSEVEGLRYPASKGHIDGYAFLERCPAIVDDFSKENAFSRTTLLEMHSVMSGISVPMTAGDGALGVLSILFKRPRAIDTAELWYLSVVANSLGVYMQKQRSLEGLEKSEKFLSSVLEGIGDGVVVVDAEYKIISANDSYLKSVDMATEEVKGRHCYEVSHHIDVPCHEKGDHCPVKAVFETGGHQFALHTHYSKDGKTIFVQTNAYPISDSSGRVVASVETLMDVTEKIRLEKDLEKRIRELEEFYEMAVGRELRMIELKEEISELREELEKHRPA